MIELALFGIWFWAFLGVIAVAFLISLINESEVWSVVTIIAGILGLQFLFKADIWSHTPGTWYGWAVLLGTYFIIGLLWSMYKFFVEYRKIVSKLWDDRHNSLPYAEREKEKDLTPEEFAAYRDKFIDDYAPKARSMKARIGGWILDWPVSMLIYLVSDLLRDLVDYMYEIFAGVYDRIAAYVRESVKKKLRG